MKYTTGSAFRQALEERIKDIHSESNIPIVRLRKQIAFERFIARLIRHQPDQWVPLEKRLLVTNSRLLGR